MILEGNEWNMSVSSPFLAHMKRLVRSALDPLPRSLSVRSLAILVTMLVAGIAISVHEYLESGKVSGRSSAARTLSDGTPQPHRTGELGSAPASLPFEIEPASVQRTTTCDQPIESEPATSSAPGLWIPDSRSTGG